MKQLIYVMITGLCLSLVFSQCKKENPDNTLSIALEKNTYYPYEIAMFETADISMSEQTYEAKINGTTYTVYTVNDKLVFTMPDIAEGDYTISIKIAGKDYETNFAMLATPAIADPDAVLDEAADKTMLQVTSLAAYADSLDAGAKNALKQDLLVIQTAMDSLRNVYAALSPSDKLECARFLAANNGWMDELYISTRDLLSASTAFKTDDAISDYESRVATAMGKFTSARLNVGKAVAKFTILTGVGFAIGTAIPVIGNTAGALTGAAVGAYLLVADLKAAQVAQEDLLNCALVPFYELFTGKTTSTVSFQNGVSQTMTSTMKYRSMYVIDRESELSIVSTYVGDCDLIKGFWEQVKPKIPASLFSFLPRSVDDVTTYNEKTYNVHAKYLSIDDINNAQVQLTSSTIEDGSLVLKFANTTGSTQPFSFYLKYDCQGLGTKYSLIDAEVSTASNVPALDSNLLGNWKCIAWMRKDYNGVYQNYMNRQIESHTADEAVCSDLSIHPDVVCTSVYTIDDFRISMSAVPHSAGKYKATSYLSQTSTECTDMLDGNWVPCEPYTLPPYTDVYNHPDNFYSINQYGVLRFDQGYFNDGTYIWQGPDMFKVTDGADNEYQVFQRQ